MILTYQVFLKKGGVKKITGKLEVFQNQIVITDMKGFPHVYKDYNNIEPIGVQMKDQDNFQDLP